jgi:predicted nucleic acid-binding protein
VIVVDASVIVWLLAEWERSKGPRLLATDDVWVAPSHLDLEVLNALRRYVALKRLTLQRAEMALAHFVKLPIGRYQLSPMLGRIWALKENLTPYDAAYVALAETLRSELLTRDARLASTPGHRARIVLAQ